MPDAVASQVIQDGAGRLIIRLTNVSDGTGESAVAKVTASTYNVSKFNIERIHYSCIGMGVRILFDATTDVLAWSLSQDMDGTLDFTGFGGIPDPLATGTTGNILFTTVGHAVGDSYAVILELRKT